MPLLFLIGVPCRADLPGVSLPADLSHLQCGVSSSLPALGAAAADRELVRARGALPSADLSPRAAASPAVPPGTRRLGFSAWRATVQKHWPFCIGHFRP